MSNVFSCQEISSITAKLAEYSVAGFSFPSLSSLKFWNGDHWLRFMSISPFLLQPIMERDTHLKNHFICWMDHLEWLTRMLQPQMSACDIDDAEKLCIAWRVRMLQLFDESKVATPNFHAILHVFEQTRRFGPPVLVWARPFEHKHSTYRGYIERYIFPWVKIISPKKKRSNAKALNIGDYVVFNDGGHREFAQITAINGENVDISHFLSGKATMNSLTKCVILNSLRKEKITINRSQVYQRFAVVHGQINRFEVPHDNCLSVNFCSITYVR